MLRIATLTSTLALMATSLMAEQIKVGVSPASTPRSWKRSPVWPNRWALR